MGKTFKFKLKMDKIDVAANVEVYDIVADQVTQLFMLVQNMMLMGQTSDSIESFANHPMVQHNSINRFISSSPIGNLVFVVGAIAYFVVFGILFSSWTQFK